MKNLFTILVLILLTGSTVLAQNKKYPDLDASPSDYATYPANSAWRNYLQGDDRNLNTKIRVLYSRPQKKGRTIFGELIPYDREWRLGANEATEIGFFQPVGIGDAVLPAGFYTIFAYVTKNNWTVHFSTERSIWGNANRDKTKDVASITVPVELLDNTVEALSMTFREIDENMVHLVVAWDKTKVAIPVTLNPAVFSGMDVSPMDQASYPPRSAFRNYAEGDERNMTPQIKVVYSRPQKKGRKIFGELLPYGEVWRIGANESTEISIYQDVKVAGQDLQAGRYALYAEVGESEWTFIFSTDLPAWGNANRDESKDVLKVTVPSSSMETTLEALTIIFEGEGNDAKLVVAWDNTRTELPITIL